MQQYTYITHDPINDESYIFKEFEDLQRYLNTFVDRLNEENIYYNEIRRYSCQNIEDAKEICEVCNIDFRWKKAAETLYSIIDPLFENNEGDLNNIDATELIDFANEEVRFTNFPYTVFKTSSDAIDFLQRYGFDIQIHCNDEQWSVDNWLEIYNIEQRRNELSKATMKFVQLTNEIKKGPLNLMNIVLVISKETNEVMNGYDFVKSIIVDEHNEQDVTHLCNEHFDDVFLAGEIDMQWNVLFKC
ncbi:hypothetical protein [Staphylococcus gallinarum]|uniref:hypothetical protein n=1 Tax=Staphylococcus gallinarum TaxID=1293 RepID=UPI001E45CDB1|nr:hypothetical protein [Staphylococcus gallinarum]MCD8845224.1 hypothetical protein [Staphylococcus gallinarum]